MLRPYTDGAPNPVDREYPVQMVGHHDELVQGDVRKMRRDFEPTIDSGSAPGVEAYFSPDDASKHGGALLRADCDEVDARA